MYFVKLQGLLEPSPMSIQPKRGLTICPKADTAQNQKRSGSCGRSTRLSRESSGIEAELTTGLSRRFMEPIPDSADWIFSLCLSSALAGGRKLCLELAADCERITGQPECMVRRFAASEMCGCHKLVCANVFGLCWSESLLARMECAALFSPLVSQS
jgi:hypothetical protein